jgi:hypothetical protein
MQIDIGKYVTDLLLVAAVALPWEVSEETFVSVAALLGDGTPLTNGERDDIGAFISLACETAGNNYRATDTTSVYRQALQNVRQSGCHVYGDESCAS